MFQKKFWCKMQTWTQIKLRQKKKGQICNVPNKQRKLQRYESKVFKLLLVEVKTISGFGIPFYRQSSHTITDQKQVLICLQMNTKFSKRFDKYPWKKRKRFDSLVCTSSWQICISREICVFTWFSLFDADASKSESWRIADTLKKSKRGISIFKQIS